MLSSFNPVVCLDVGANKGDYSETLLSTTNASVYAFEPLPLAFAKLDDLASRYKSRFVPINKGVGKEAAYLDLFYGEEDSELATFSSEVNGIEYVGSKNVNSMLVEIIALDDFYETTLKGKFSELDLLKIDTEGFEYEVLLGSKKVISMLKPKFVQIEYNWHQLFRNHSLKDISSLLPNYTVYQLLPYGRGLVKRDVNKPESNIYHYSNFVFVRDDVKLD